MGTWTYEYDRQGNLTAQLDAETNVTCLAYDGIGRLSTKRWLTGTLESCVTAQPPVIAIAPVQTITYDGGGTAGRGLVNRIVRGEGGSSYYTRTLSYDGVGQLATEQVQIAVSSGSGVQSFATGYIYDSAGRVITTTYPTNEGVGVVYNGMGLPARLRSSVKGVLADGDVTTTRIGNAVRYDEAGRLVGMRFPAGGNLWRTNSYAPFGQQNNDGGMLTGIKVGTAFGNGSSLTLGYAYDSFGNVATLTDGGAWPFTYDGQNRVVGAFNRSYSYWPSGRFNQFEGVAYSYGTGAATSPLHAVVSTNAGGVFTYDAAGNMLTRKTTSAAPVQTLAWSPANELLSVTTGATVESYRIRRRRDAHLPGIEDRRQPRLAAVRLLPALHGRAARRARCSCREKRPAQTKVRCARTGYALYCSLLPTCSEFAR